MDIPDSSVKAWSMESEEYVKASVETINDLLAGDGRELKRSKRERAGPLPPGYAPEFDVTKECNEEPVSQFRQIIGIFRWAIELGKVDILIGVSCPSQYQALQRIGHREALYLIPHFLTKHPSLSNQSSNEENQVLAFPNDKLASKNVVIIRAILGSKNVRSTHDTVNWKG